MVGCRRAYRRRLEDHRVKTRTLENRRSAAGRRGDGV
jgi:hypothetical protein